MLLNCVGALYILVINPLVVTSLCLLFAVQKLFSLIKSHFCFLWFWSLIEKEILAYSNVQSFLYLGRKIVPCILPLCFMELVIYSVLGQLLMRGNEIPKIEIAVLVGSIELDE